MHPRQYPRHVAFHTVHRRPDGDEPAQLLSQAGGRDRSNPGLHHPGIPARSGRTAAGAPGRRSTRLFTNRVSRIAVLSSGGSCSVSDVRRRCTANRKSVRRWKRMQGRAQRREWKPRQPEVAVHPAGRAFRGGAGPRFFVIRPEIAIFASGVSVYGSSERERWSFFKRYQHENCDCGRQRGCGPGIFENFGGTRPGDPGVPVAVRFGTQCGTDVQIPRRR